MCYTQRKIQTVVLKVEIISGACGQEGGVCSD